MDRSSFHFAGSTNDLQKRLEFKAKLANKIEPLQPKEIPVTDNTFNGVFPGGILVHPSLGEGILVEIDQSNNEILIDFGPAGLIGLVLSQVKTVLQAPKKEVKIVDDPFIGEEIKRLTVNRPDVVYREVNYSSSKEYGKEFVSPLVEGMVVHNTKLGECTVVSIDKKSNEIVLKSVSQGLVSLAFSQAKNFLTPVDFIRKEDKVVDDPFIGGEIQRDGAPGRDIAYRQADFSKITSADFVVSGKEYLPVGSLVWHPDLGACKISSLNEGTNSLTLDTPLNGRVDMVLSQVHAKLRQIDAVADHVPVKPLVREPLGQRFPQYKSRGDVSVNLPEVFNNWQRNQQFMFLTRSQHLTTEQANDVFSVLEDKKPLFHTVTVSWQSTEETQANIILGREDLSVRPELKISASILDQEAVWHPDLGECTISSVDKKNNQLILLTSIGQIPCVLDVTVPTLAPIALNSGIKRAPKALRTSRVLAAMEGPVKDRPKVSVSIPESIVTWKALEQYQYLTNSVHLTPEQANDIISSLSGTLRISKHEYEIQWTDEVPEAVKRAEVEQRLSDRIEAASVVQELPAPPAPVDSGIKRVVEEVVEVKKTQVLKKVEIDLPADFNKWTASGQYVFLTRTRHLTSNEANDVLDILHGKPINSSIQYEIVWSE